ncbi:MAG TPA: hypothetical protein VHZ73_09595 [Vicinamibacterales bacterium]|nr:hypothetical protein [Vicinamibacterales bacterium]
MPGAMPDHSTVFHDRKQREIDELRVAASRAFANAALRVLDDAERHLHAMASGDDGGRVEALISQARDVMSDKRR